MNDATTYPTASFETVTPELAQQYLGVNDSNRSVSETTVDKYARDMQMGAQAWDDPCLQPLIFDVNGRLIDGQHRLLALNKTGTTSDFLVVRNADPESQKHLDTGKARTVADVLHFMGESNSNMLAAVARTVHRIDKGLIAGGATVTTSEVLAILEKYPDIRHSAEMALLSTAGRSQTMIAPSVFGAGHWMIAQVNGHADADLFLWRLYNLVGEGQGSPVLALNRRTNEIRRQVQRVHHRDYLAMLIKAWNMDATNKTAVKIATYSKTGTYVLPAVVKRKVSLVEEWDEKTDVQAEIPDSDEEGDE